MGSIDNGAHCMLKLTGVHLTMALQFSRVFNGHLLTKTGYIYTIYLYSCIHIHMLYECVCVCVLTLKQYT